MNQTIDKICSLSDISKVAGSIIDIPQLIYSIIGELRVNSKDEATLPDSEIFNDMLNVFGDDNLPFIIDRIFVTAWKAALIHGDISSLNHERQYRFFKYDSQYTECNVIDLQRRYKFIGFSKIGPEVEYVSIACRDAPDGFISYNLDGLDVGTIIIPDNTDNTCDRVGYVRIKEDEAN